jgi:cytochrome c551/c552
MKQKIFFTLATLIAIVAISCNSGTNSKTAANHIKDSAGIDCVQNKKSDTVVLSQGANAKGIGRFKEIQLTHPLDEGMYSKGEASFNAKCIACHKLTNEKLVGPGWKGVTDRRTPEWIMNFITNTQVMLDKDLVAQSEMVTCVVRMPNQDLTDEQARQILEFMRKNDGKK